jgi:hypothetical protein
MLKHRAFPPCTTGILTLPSPYACHNDCEFHNTELMNQARICQRACYTVRCPQNHQHAPKDSLLPIAHSYRKPGKPQSQVLDQTPCPQAVQDTTFLIKITW